MEFDFTQVLDRVGKDAKAVEQMPIKTVAVKEGFSRIPMWVADMNFATAPSVQKAIAERLQHPAFGYFSIRREYYDGILRWQQTRNGVTGLTAADIGYENSVLGALGNVIRGYTMPGDSILLHAPTYIGFTKIIHENGRVDVLSSLVLDENNVWRMDYQDMENKIVANHIRLVVLCSPHNPCGRVWEREELERTMEICRRHDCLVFSDEIWSDLTLDGRRHIPTQMISEDAKQRTIALYGGTKTFNLAGVRGAYHIVYNEHLRNRMEHNSEASHYNRPNLMSVYALIGAYQPEGMRWVEELRQVLKQNVEYACEYISDHFAGVRVSKPQATYMLLLDCEQWCMEHQCTMQALLEKGVEYGVLWQDGRPFHHPWGIRVNVALPFAMLQEAMRRLEQYVFLETTI